MGCHCLLQSDLVRSVKVFCSDCASTSVGHFSCSVLSDLLRLHGSMDCSPQGPQPMDFSRQGYRSGLPFPSPGSLPDPGIEPGCPELQMDSLLSEPPGSHDYEIAYFSFSFVIFSFICVGTMLLLLDAFKFRNGILYSCITPDFVGVPSSVRDLPVSIQIYREVSELSHTKVMLFVFHRLFNLILNKVFMKISLLYL